ncbi:Ig-like domain-containing protein [Solibacillus sp. FSL K6-1554]|uniref:Ig-like domain-containing protein n=1 Tax=Solibacillus sp. FSL K6-1554 TaxID=2921472 RepID=UPI0030FC2429
MKLWRNIFISFISIVCISVIFFSKENNALAAEDDLGNFTDVPVDKVWKVTFNQEIDPNTIHNIGVGLDGVYLDTIIVELGEDKRTVYVKNTESYNFNSHYVLDFKRSLKSLNGISLKNYQYVTFSTKKEIIDVGDGEKYGEWTVYKTEDNFRFFIDDDSKDYLFIYRDAEKIFIDIEKYFNHNMTQVVDVYLRRTGDRGGAFYSSGDNTMQIYPHHFGDDTRYHFSHEAVHAITDSIWNMDVLMGKDELWIVEGIAEYVPKHHIDFPACSSCGELKPLKYGKEEYIYRFNNKSHREDLVQIDNLLELDQTKDTHSYLAYESMIYYLVETYSWDQLMNFVSDRSNGKSNEVALKENFEITESQLIINWKAYYRLK